MIKGLCFLLAVFGLDRTLKLWLEHNFSYLSLAELNNQIFDIYLVKNKGVAFSLLENNPLIIKLITLVFLAYSIFYLIKNKSYLSTNSWISWGILLGGVIGNFFDRISYGYVIDYIKLKFIDFPVMNLADIAINLGIITIIILVLTNNELENAD